MQRALPAIALALSTPIAGARQEPYRLPPPGVVAIADADPSPSVALSPDGARMLLLERDAMPRVADLARPMLRLAGMRIDPAASARFTTSFVKGLELRPLLGGTGTRVPLPEGARVGFASWSHGGARFVYSLVTEAGTELWGMEVDGSQPRLLTDRLSTITQGITWMPDGERVLCVLVPEDRGAAPERPPVPPGPAIQETSGSTSPLRTYQDLLADEHDAALFDHFARGELVAIDVASGGLERLPVAAGIFAEAAPSPDGRYLLVERVERPYSYLMPWSMFPRTIEVLDAGGRRARLVADLPLTENVPIGGVRTGPRMVGWKAGEPATLVWAEALDGGDPGREAAHRDRWLRLAAPFEGAPKELFRLAQRATGLDWLADPRQVLSSEYDRDRRWTRTLLHDLSGSGELPKVVEDRSVRDRYGDPGRILTRPDASGKRVAVQEGEWIFRAGSGQSPVGALPFLDRQSLETLASERLWRCAEGAYERVEQLLAAGGEPRFVTQHETPDSPPNLRLWRAGGDEPRALTDFPDPTPQIRGIEKRLVTYEREDGVPLSATLYLPAGHEQGTRLPLFVWAYPREYNDPDTAGQVSGSPWTFTRLSGASHLYLTTQGYAVMDAAAMPIIGDAETMNDTFLEQLVASARAAIEHAAELGVADPGRALVGGHSYGAFMTANLLAHCELFRAGIARSGAYNRTLTPFGFQSERRTLWEAPETYFEISPFLHAQKIAAPLLLIHGAIDDNSGTFPMQSERLFQAIKGHGGTARLVMLPHESHGYRARESVLHVLAEMIDWAQRWTGDARPVEAAAVPAEAASEGP